MKLEVDRRDATAGSVDAVAVGVVERGEKDEPLPRVLASENALLKGLVASAWERKEVRGKRRELTVFHRPDGKGRLLLIGLGPRSSLDVDQIRQAAAHVVRQARGRGIRTLGFRLASYVGDGVGPEAAARALADGASLGEYEFRKFRQKTDSHVEESTIFLGEEHAREEGGIRKAVQEQGTLLASVLWTRDIANVPADTATPEWLAEEARKLGKEVGLKVTVFDEKKLAEMNCGGLLGVGSGSAHPPRLVVLEYAGGARSGKTVAVVGKGITFDSGGISIKPALAMSDMKFDKSGACAVLGVMRAAAQLKVGPRVVGVMACAENLPSSTAYRPGDVVRTYGGQSIEVLNTDAEGRVVLADALGYVNDKYRPDVILDLATLTGACVTALGDDIAGLVTTNEELARSLLDASRDSGEWLWRLPLTETHREMVKSDVADVRNSAEGLPAGALTAAAFLETFVGKTPWAHLDIAGPAYVNVVRAKYVAPYQNLGATGFGVRLVMHYLLRGAR